MGLKIFRQKVHNWVWGIIHVTQVYVKWGGHCDGSNKMGIIVETVVVMMLTSPVILHWLYTKCTSLGLMGG